MKRCSHRYSEADSNDTAGKNDSKGTHRLRRGTSQMEAVEEGSLEKQMPGWPLEDEHLLRLK